MSITSYKVAIYDPNHKIEKLLRRNIVYEDAATIQVDLTVFFDEETVDNIQILYGDMELFLVKGSFTTYEEVPLKIKLSSWAYIKNTEATLSFSIDPIPKEYKPSSIPLGGIPGPGPYLLKTKLRVENSSLDLPINFHINYKDDKPTIKGELVISEVKLSDYIYEEGNSDLKFSDDYTELYCNFVITAKDYSPTMGAIIEVAAAIVGADYSIDQYILFEEQKVNFSSPQSAVSLKAKDIRPLFNAQPFDLFITVFSEGRKGHIKLRTNLIPGKVPSRPIYPLSYVINQNGTEVKSIGQLTTGAFSIVINYLNFSVEEIGQMTHGLMLCIPFNNSDAQIQPSHSVLFSVVDYQAQMGKDTVNIEYFFPGPADDLIKAKVITPNLMIGFSWKDVFFRNWYRMKQFGETQSLKNAGINAIDIPSFMSNVNNYTVQRWELDYRKSMHSVPRPRPQIDPANLSGSHWCAYFPNRTSVNDLEESFRGKVNAFISMLQSNGASISIGCTRRDSRRAALMHYAWAVANREILPYYVPPIVPLPIIWAHETLEKSVAKALEMVQGYGIVYKPALNSGHIRGVAIDMNISNLPRKLKVNGETIDIGTVTTGANNTKLHQIAYKYFGIKKLASDPPHWYN